MKLNIAVTGASGFVGSKLVRSLSVSQPDSNIVALSRGEPRDLPSGVKWKSTDLYVQKQIESALEGVDIAFYLVHSMLPSSRLFQGSFSDTDLLLADNFLRACEKHNVKQIIYLGGLVPEGHLSEHLQSRNEVETVFRHSKIPTTAFRAGMVVGDRGSSFNILRALVKNLPAMILPSWTQTETQVVWIEDLVRVLAHSVANKAFFDQTIDVVTGEHLNYENLLRETAAVMGLKRSMFSVPISSVQFSKRWVSLFGEADIELVSPLVDSLLCDFKNKKIPDLIKDQIQVRTYAEMLEKVKDSPIPKRAKRKKAKLNTVRSIQRLPSKPNLDCQQIAYEYMRWLEGNFFKLIEVHSDLNSGIVEFKLAFLPQSVLVLKTSSKNADPNLQRFDVVGGVLSETIDTGWLEFRQIAGKRFTLSSVHEFIPKLPWNFYLLTQAPIHHWVMKNFAKYLSRLQS